MLRRPGFIERGNIASVSLRFLWDELNVRQAYQPPDATLLDKLTSASRRANCALTIGIAEWIIYRFEPFDLDPEPLQFIESAWAANIDLRYSEEIEIVDDEWRGPVRGPISMALTFVLDALFAEEAGANSVFNPAWAATFARHVLPSVTLFNDWLDVCVPRVAQLSVAPTEDSWDWFDPSSNWGALVPREALNPDVEFHPEMSLTLLQQFLDGLDPATNPFLRTPDEMIAADFPGIPYRLP